MFKLFYSMINDATNKINTELFANRKSMQYFINHSQITVYKMIQA